MTKTEAKKAFTDYLDAEHIDHRLLKIISKQI